MTISQGGYYRNPSGTLISTSPGQVLPDAWKYVGTNDPQAASAVQFQSPPTAATSPPVASLPQQPASVPASVSPTQAAATEKPTPAGVKNIADGSTYVNPSGTYISTISSGEPLPDSWSKVTPSDVPVGTPVVQNVGAGTLVAQQVANPTARVSTGGTYLTPGGTAVQLPAGSGVPDSWIDVAATQGASTTGKTVIVAPDGNAVAQQAYLTKILAGIIAIGGVGLLVWLGYKVWNDPETVVRLLSKMKLMKDLLLDTAQIAVFATTLAVIGYVGYQFFSAYEANSGDIAATIGDLVSDVFVTVVEAIGDALIDLVKKLASAIWDAI